ncbi:MAG TPA: SLBB domain-containing protein, partial [Syntrophales bacterium]|nr:SLBB domain-containing protein [Syntrophales bacterium]
ILGPGDQFTLTLWGTTEGIYNLTISKEGHVTLPKVGVVPVAGTRFGELENTLRKHLSQYYTNFNLSVAMGKLKTITLYLVGEVTNPGSYSLNSLTSVYDALVAAGGPTKKGTLRSIQVLRGGKVIRTIDLYDFLLKGVRNQDINLQQEDTIFVPLIGPIAGVSGSVYRPAIYELKGNESIGDVLRLAGGIMPIAVANRLQVYRFSDNEKKLLIDINISSRAVDGIRNGDMLQEKVQNMDLLSVRPIYDKVWETVSLEGDVRHPGDYQWKQDLKLKDIIQEGQLLPTADINKAEIIRLTDDYHDRKIIPINLASAMNGDDGQNIALQPKDRIRVFTLYHEVEKVKLTGEVMSPGDYEIQKGERLSDILRRAGGFTSQAYAYGTVFKRLDVKSSQDKNLQPFLAKMQSQAYSVAASEAASASSPEAQSAAKAQLTISQSLIENLKIMQQQSEGRVSINITEDVNQWAGSKDDLLLKNGDTVFVPKKPQEVMVMGEVHSPSAQVFIDGYKVKDYINLTGGYTDSAAKDQVYVLQANGFAYSGETPGVDKIENAKLKPGDTILVPQKAERNAGWRYFRDIMDVLFKTAVVVATLAVLHL